MFLSRKNKNNEKKFFRILYTTDLHGSDIAYRKLISGAKAYSADTIIMGGDVSGKTMVPIVMNSRGSYSFEYLSKKYTDLDDSKLKELQLIMKNSGVYYKIFTREEYSSIQNNPNEMSELFDDLVLERLNEWAKIAIENLENLGIKIYWSGGNDDVGSILEKVKSNEYYVYTEEKVVKINDSNEMLSIGWSNPTPWNTPRECSEDELRNKIEEQVRKINDLKLSIFNIHAPPYNSTLDDAPKFDTSTYPPKPIISGGQVIKIPVGSTAVRGIIEKYQPLLGLHGHIHEIRGGVEIGRTTCINSGSEYESGILDAAIINIKEDKILSYQMVST